MTDTVRTRSYMVGDGDGNTGTFKNNTSGAITAQVVRDFIASIPLTTDWTSYVLVKQLFTNTDVANGTALRSAYTAAKALTPGGNAISSTNRVAVIIPPGRYDLVTTPLTLDTTGVDLVGMGDACHVIITSQVSSASHGTVEQTAADVRIQNCTIDIATATYTLNYDDTDPAAYFPSSFALISNDSSIIANANEVRYPAASTVYVSIVADSALWKINFYNDSDRLNLIGHTASFAAGTVGRQQIVADSSSGMYGYITLRYTTGIGTNTSIIITVAGLPFCYNVNFTNSNDDTCLCMRANMNYPGTYINCTCGNYGFGWGLGSSPIAEGTFVNCVGGNGCFGGFYEDGDTNGYGIATGTFVDCQAGSKSFGGLHAQGTFLNCQGSRGSFGNEMAYGTFINCTGGDGCFGGGVGSNGGGDAQGTFINCTADSSSFGEMGNGGRADGVFINCIGGGACFGDTSCTGYFENCIGGSGSWSADANIIVTAKLINCRLGSITGNTLVLGGFDWTSTFAGYMEGCYWQITGDTQDALPVNASAKIYNSTIIGTQYSLTAGDNVAVECVHSRLKGVIEETPGNGVNTDKVTLPSPNYCTTLV
jgi:hypothetical protein